MPLFGHKEPAQPVVEERHGLFGRKRSPSPVATTSTRHSTFGHSSSHSNTTSVSPTRKTGFLHRNDEDASIIAAKTRVATAEAREKEADRALMHARVAVREAREHIRLLEKEAAEQARLAKVKQQQAKSLSKKGGLLGRESALLIHLKPDRTNRNRSRSYAHLGCLSIGWVSHLENILSRFSGRYHLVHEARVFERCVCIGFCYFSWVFCTKLASDGVSMEWIYRGI